MVDLRECIGRTVVCTKAYYKYFTVHDTYAVTDSGIKSNSGVIFFPEKSKFELIKEGRPFSCGDYPSGARLKCTASDNHLFLVNKIYIVEGEGLRGEHALFTTTYSEFILAKDIPTVAEERKSTPVYSGVLKYFPDALKAIAQCSKAGNDQHNPGEPLHWDRSKSGDELDALTRHLLDAGTIDTDGVRHSTKVAWRALSNLQKEIENDGV